MAARMPNERPLRTGYTTGACAAAAAKAAAMALLEQNMIRRVEISLPGGQQAAFAISNCAFDSGMAMCSVTKDAGDDPDVTNGAEIWASVCRDDGPGITIRGSRGVGRVTRPGLEVAVGMPAINPVPRQMILESVREVVKDGRGVLVTIHVALREAVDQINEERARQAAERAKAQELRQAEDRRQTLMALADVAMYAALLGEIGLVPLAVTTSLNINFLRKPVPGWLVADCRLLKLGRRLAVGEVTIAAEGGDDAVAHATLTYSIPG